MRTFPAMDFANSGRLPDLGSIQPDRLAPAADGLDWQVPSYRALVAMTVVWETACLRGSGSLYFAFEPTR